MAATGPHRGTSSRKASYIANSINCPEEEILLTGPPNRDYGRALCGEKTAVHNDIGFSLRNERKKQSISSLLSLADLGIPSDQSLLMLDNDKFDESFRIIHSPPLSPTSGPLKGVLKRPRQTAPQFQIRNNHEVADLGYTTLETVSSSNEIDSEDTPQIESDSVFSPQKLFRILSPGLNSVGNKDTKEELRQKIFAETASQQLVRQLHRAYESGDIEEAGVVATHTPEDIRQRLAQIEMEIYKNVSQQGDNHSPILPALAVGRDGKRKNSHTLRQEASSNLYLVRSKEAENYNRTTNNKKQQQKRIEIRKTPDGFVGVQELHSEGPTPMNNRLYSEFPQADYFAAQSILSRYPCAVCGEIVDSDFMESIEDLLHKHTLRHHGIQSVLGSENVPVEERNAYRVCSACIQVASLSNKKTLFLMQSLSEDNPPQKFQLSDTATGEYLQGNFSNGKNKNVWSFHTRRAIMHMRNVLFGNIEMPAKLSGGTNGFTSTEGQIGVKSQDFASSLSPNYHMPPSYLTANASWNEGMNSRRNIHMNVSADEDRRVLSVEPPTTPSTTAYLKGAVLNGFSSPIASAFEQLSRNNNHRGDFETPRNGGRCLFDHSKSPRVLVLPDGAYNYNSLSQSVSPHHMDVSANRKLSSHSTPINASFDNQNHRDSKILTNDSRGATVHSSSTQRPLVLVCSGRIPSKACVPANFLKDDSQFDPIEMDEFNDAVDPLYFQPPPSPTPLPPAPLMQGDGSNDHSGMLAVLMGKGGGTTNVSGLSSGGQARPILVGSSSKLSVPGGGEKDPGDMLVLDSVMESTPPAPEKEESLSNKGSKMPLVLLESDASVTPNRGWRSGKWSFPENQNSITVLEPINASLAHNAWAVADKNNIDSQLKSNLQSLDSNIVNRQVNNEMKSTISNQFLSQGLNLESPSQFQTKNNIMDSFYKNPSLNSDTQDSSSSLAALQEELKHAPTSTSPLNNDEIQQVTAMYLPALDLAPLSVHANRILRGEKAFMSPTQRIKFPTRVPPAEPFSVSPITSHRTAAGTHEQITFNSNSHTAGSLTSPQFAKSNIGMQTYHDSDLFITPRKDNQMISSLNTPTKTVLRTPPRTIVRARQTSHHHSQTTPTALSKLPPPQSVSSTSPRISYASKNDIRKGKLQLTHNLIKEKVIPTAFLFKEDQRIPMEGNWSSGFANVDIVLYESDSDDDIVGNKPNVNTYSKTDSTASGSFAFSSASSSQALSQRNESRVRDHTFAKPGKIVVCPGVPGWLLPESIVPRTEYGLNAFVHDYVSDQAEKVRLARRERDEKERLALEAVRTVESNIKSKIDEERNNFLKNWETN